MLKANTRNSTRDINVCLVKSSAPPGPPVFWFWYHLLAMHTEGSHFVELEWVQSCF